MATIALSVVGASASGDLAGYLKTDHGQLIGHLERRGHAVVDVGSPMATHFVAMDHNRASLEAIRHAIPRQRRHLVVFEPRVVLPANYIPRIHREYGSVVGMTPDVRGTGGTFLFWPQRDWRARPAPSRERVSGSTALINANKLSAVRGSLYGLRRRVIQEFSDARLPLTLAGPNWLRRGRPLLIENLRAIAYAALNKQRIDVTEWAAPLRLSSSVTHLGRVDDKEAVLLGSEFSVVIENSATYVSEKLFDAVIAGTVPLYTGPPLAAFGIPEDVVVRMGTSPAEFASAVRALSTAHKADVLAAGRDWLGSDKTFARWAMPMALDALAANIDQQVSRSGTTT